MYAGTHILTETIKNTVRGTQAPDISPDIAILKIDINSTRPQANCQ